MDAHAHLLSLGWAGPGHSLDSRPPLQHKGRRGLAYDTSQNNNTGRGLVKPLLVSQKKNTLGVGKKTHEPAAGNEWWLKGFESALNNIGKNNRNEATSGTATPESAVANASGYRGKHVGLYGCFVKGQQMEGTIREEEAKRPRGQKRKGDTFDDEAESSTSSEMSSPIISSSQKRVKPKVEAAVDFEQISQFLDIRDKDRKRQEKQAIGDPAQEFEQMSHFFEARSGREKKRKSKKVDGDSSAALTEGKKTIKEDSTEKRRRRRKEAEAGNGLIATDLDAKEKDRKARKAANSAL
jgi:hypothetical protein